MRQHWEDAAAEWISPLAGGEFNQKVFNRLLRDQNALYQRIGPEWADFSLHTDKVWEFYNPGLNTVAGYFAYDDAGKFHGVMNYGKDAFKNHLQFFAVRIHEMEHAHQYETMPVMHAVPYNPNTDYILCPLDFCLMLELSERAAYTRERIARAKYKEFTTPDAPMDQLEQMLKYMPGLTPANLASQILERMSEPGTRISALQLYRDIALTAYETSLRRRLDNGTFKNITMIKLSPEDILAIGERMGLSLFRHEEGGHQYDPELIAATPGQQARLEFLTRMLGCEKRSNLFTLKEELEAAGSTPGQFLAQNLARHYQNLPKPADGPPASICN